MQEVDFVLFFFFIYTSQINQTVQSIFPQKGLARGRQTFWDDKPVSCSVGALWKLICRQFNMAFKYTKSFKM